MRIIQIIDSMEAGGAERMAVNYANALSQQIDFSGLVSTRKEGPLLFQLDKSVDYLFLNKRNSLDLKAVLRLRRFVIKHKVTLVHAHGTSFFIAFLLKIIYPQIKIVWHEHYGARIHQSRKDNLILFFSSFFFSAIFVVNYQLETWVQKKLGTKDVFYIPNFAMSNINQTNETFLKGDDDKRIICLANLKPPKNHIAIVTAFKELKLGDLGWSLHLIGKDYEDSYSLNLKDFINENNLANAIFMYGSRNDVEHILSQATIGILASTDEGFPISLLEYGLSKLAVVSTNVGYCSEVIINNNSGLLFNPLDIFDLRRQLGKLISDENLRNRFATHLKVQVERSYSKKNSIDLLISKYMKVLK